MEFYDESDLELIVARSADLLGVQLDSSGAAEIAGRSRGTPRIVNRLLRRVRDYAQVHGDGTIDRATAQAALALFEVDADGLDRLDRSVLEALVKSFGGGPAGLSTLAVAVGRGRVATVAAWEYFGLSPVSGGIGANTTRAGQAVLPIGVDEEG